MAEEELVVKPVKVEAALAVLLVKVVEELAVLLVKVEAALEEAQWRSRSKLPPSWRR